MFYDFFDAYLYFNRHLILPHSFKEYDTSIIFVHHIAFTQFQLFYHLTAFNCFQILIIIYTSADTCCHFLMTMLH